MVFLLRLAIAFRMIRSVLVIRALIISVFGFINLNKPSNNGTVYISNVLESVTVVKDEWGIPHIEAENQHDAIFTYGYTIAKGRLFQMDLQRRLARGQLAEILGKDLVKIDKMLRTYMLAHHAKKYISDSTKISPDALKYVDAFIEGINYFIKTTHNIFQKTLLHLVNHLQSFFIVRKIYIIKLYIAFKFSKI